ncbi:hypothetical protein BDV37DRAFT_276489 [Aspergillus pseudonomiae]|uniref:Fungal-type protein kinase domain-containing protein n=1 Tax=Aspergillus pseudonomiae TaxID=1506151 RepID=A0A5N7CW52_9EURO|nr:uncharacterized protein BDV37DRAFT_276489 [Aspergillus pseudonomiae]KAE8397967.1 hypothetical protein BDV37DRAFT_276489 [Aspergillus pseudonomiae]
MAQLSKREIIESRPIGDGLNAFRDEFVSTCRSSGLPCSVQSVHELDHDALQNLCICLILALQALPASRALPPVVGAHKNLFNDLSRLSSSVNSDEFNLERLLPLLIAAFERESDEVIWDNIYAAAAETTPPPRPPPYVEQTPYSCSTSMISNSHERRDDIDPVLKEELGSIYTDVPGFEEAFFGGVEDLEKAGTAVFHRSIEGDDPLYRETAGWRDWPQSAQEKQVLDWLVTKVERFYEIATENVFAPKNHRKVLGWPHQPLQGSTAARKLDIGFIPSLESADKSTLWSHILVIGELKRNPKMDTASSAWRDLGRYAREVFAAQDTRRYVLGFTLCGPILRLWEFDRIGAIASTPFDVNKDPVRFIISMLGFLQMDSDQLGYDPTILTSSEGYRYVQIVRDGQPERLILEERMRRASCVVGRATICWKAYREGDKSKTPLVIKDSWQYPEREEEGALLRDVTQKGVVNVARYYYHGTVQVDGKNDDIQAAVRRGLDMARAKKYRFPRSDVSYIGFASTDGSKASHSAGGAGHKRSSSHLEATLPSTKRSCSSSPIRDNHSQENRVHRRVIVRDYGVPIYKAESRVVILSALERCIEGYESLHLHAGLFQGDISTGNLIINNEEGNPSWPAFLIDLDLAIWERREQPSGARGKTGTRAFMAIGLLLGEKHSFMHDLESFFWVIFWICIHYPAFTKKKVVRRFEKWNYVDMEELAELKKGTVAHEGDFLHMVEDLFTDFYKPLGPWVNRLRKVVFPNGGRWEKETKDLYVQMREVLKDACKDPKVLAE